MPSYATTRILQDQSFFFSDFQIFKNNDFLDFWMTGFLNFCILFGFLAVSQEWKELPEIRGCQNNQIFEGFSDFQKKILDVWMSGFFWFLAVSRERKVQPEFVFIWFLNFRISVFFLYFCPYLWNEKSYWKSTSVKTTGFFRDFQVPACVLQPERPKGAVTLWRAHN